MCHGRRQKSMTCASQPAASCDIRSCRNYDGEGKGGKLDPEGVLKGESTELVRSRKMGVSAYAIGE